MDLRATTPTAALPQPPLLTRRGFPSSLTLFVQSRRQSLSWENELPILWHSCGASGSGINPASGRAEQNKERKRTYEGGVDSCSTNRLWRGGEHLPLGRARGP